jgi:hypothetical protein
VYPFATDEKPIQVTPALSWKSRVVYFKVVKAGSPVSYGSTWRSDHDVRMVTVPVGYGDGYFRSMSNKAQVLLRGQRHAQAGAICMDQMMVNIEQGSGYNGDEVVLIGEQDGQRVTVEELARWAGTIPYEILTAISERVPKGVRDVGQPKQDDRLAVLCGYTVWPNMSIRRRSSISNPEVRGRLMRSRSLRSAIELSCQQTRCSTDPEQAAGSCD